MYSYKIRPAFTMLELVFVIVILGIVSSIGSTIIAQLFENTINQRALHKASLKTELAANQIVNRLTYRLPHSLITRGFNAGGNLNNTYRVVENIEPNDSNTNPEALEWIGYDNDSFATAARPGWSGYCDTTATNTGVAGVAKNRIVTRGSDLNLTNTVIANLSGTTKTIADSAVVFSTSTYNNAGLSYNAACLGYTDSTCIHAISAINANTLIKDNNYAIGDTISDHFKLAWSAYALVPVNIRNNNLFDLNLCYNYQPWDNDTIANDATCSLFMKNVTSFKYNEVAGTVRFKICATENIGTDVNVSVCKEKVVIR